MARDITKLHPRLQAIIAELKKICEEQGLKLGIGECFRSVEEQNDLYAQGRTKPGNVVTNAKGTSYSSQHQWGIAFDFFKNVKGHEFDDSSFFVKVASIAKGLGLAWGGDWKSIVDKPHLYLPDWGSTTSKLKKQYGTPDKFMATWKPEEKATLATAQKKLKQALKIEEGSATLKDAQKELKKALKIEDVGHSGNTELPTDILTIFIKGVQAATGSKVDGIAGNETISNTVTVSMNKNRKHPVVKAIQTYLNQLGFNCGTVDGIAGNKFDLAVKAYQKAHGCVADGELTARNRTWRKLLGMA